MSNGHRWELSEWGDGTVRLAHWNSLTGEDTIIVLNPDGTASLSSYTDDSDTEIYQAINLQQYLTGWLAAQDTPA